jgi:hypothetical protein
MANLTSGELIVLLVGVVACVLLAAAGLYLRRRLRERGDQLRQQLSNRRHLVGDRAFNRIAMARRESEILARQGTDVSAATTLVGRAQAAFDSREYGRAYELAQSAHESLVALRSGRGPSPGAPLPGATGSPPPASPVRPAEAPAPPATPPPAAIPKHRAEAQFQLRLLATEIDRARRTPGSAPPSEAGVGTLTAAQAAFDRGDYTEAFRRALKGRRQVGGGVEALGPSPALGPPGAGPVPTPDHGAPDPAEIAERHAAATRCPSCGQPLLADDAFCRGCGTPRSVGSCPKCGAPRALKDGFCGKCGAPFA